MAARITVNSTDDSNIRNGILTLREAILVANGTQNVAALTVAEQAQINGTVGTGADRDTIALPPLVCKRIPAKLNLSIAKPCRVLFPAVILSPVVGNPARLPPLFHQWQTVIARAALTPTIDDCWIGNLRQCR